MHLELNRLVNSVMCWVAALTILRTFSIVRYRSSIDDMLLRAGGLVTDIYLTLHTPVHLEFSPTLMAVGSETGRFLLVSSAGGHFVAVIGNRYS